MTRIMWRVVIAWALTVGFVGIATGQEEWEDEDRRSGFVVGFSLGPALTLLDFGDARFALATDLRVGGEVGKRTQIYYLNQVSFFNPGDEWVNDLVAAGLTGIGVTFPASSRASISIGAGFSSWTELAEHGWTNPKIGWGAMADLGYEFANRWLVDLSMGYASTGREWGPPDVLTVKFGVGFLGH